MTDDFWTQACKDMTLMSLASDKDPRPSPREVIDTLLAGRYSMGNSTTEQYQNRSNGFYPIVPLITNLNVLSLISPCPICVDRVFTAFSFNPFSCLVHLLSDSNGQSIHPACVFFVFPSVCYAFILST